MTPTALRSMMGRSREPRKESRIPPVASPHDRGPYPLRARPGVDKRGADRAMPEGRLYQKHVAGLRVEPHRERIAEAVRRVPPPDPSPTAPLLEAPLHVARSQRAAVAAGKDRTCAAVCGERPSAWSWVWKQARPSEVRCQARFFLVASCAMYQLLAEKKRAWHRIAEKKRAWHRIAGNGMPSFERLFSSAHSASRPGHWSPVLRYSSGLASSGLGPMSTENANLAPRRISWTSWATGSMRGIHSSITSMDAAGVRTRVSVRPSQWAVPVYTTVPSSSVLQAIIAKH
jgi:hypothetical protein